MIDMKKTVIEEVEGVSGFLVPVQVLPVNLVGCFGLKAPFRMTATGSMVEINGEVFFEVDKWQLARK